MSGDKSRTRGSGTWVSRRVALGLILSGGVAIGIQRSGAFSSVQGDRQPNIGATDDENAVLGIDLKHPSGTDGDRVELAELENRLVNPLDTVDITVHDTGTIDLTDVQHPSGLSPGSSGSVSAQIDCSNSITETVTLEIDVSGSEQSIVAERDVDVTCGSEQFDPFDCQDVWKDGEDHCDYRERGELELEGTTREGNVCVTSRDDSDIQLQGGSGIEGFLRVEAGGGADLDMEGDGSIEKTVVINACGEVNVDIDSGTIEGDLCIDTGGDVDGIGDGAVVEGDLKIDASGDVDIDEGTVEGTTEEGWNSGFDNSHC